MTSEYLAAKKERRRIFRLSHAKRTKEFVSAVLLGEDKASLGWVTWYGATGSSLSSTEHYLTGETVDRLDVVGCSLPIKLTFRGSDLAKYFKPGEDVPCLMRGSVYALWNKGGWAEKVLTRQIAWWVRKRRITCLSRTAWEGLRSGEFWWGRYRHLVERYKDSGRGHWGSALVDRFVDTCPPIDPMGTQGGWVLINGERMCVDGEKLAALQDMHRLERKLRVAA